MYTIEDIQLLGIKKGLLLLGHISEIFPRENCLIIKTLDNPKFVSANYILFRDSPTIESVKEWPNIFRKEFSNHSDIKHIKLVLDTGRQSKKIVDSFKREGFNFEDNETLALDSLQRPITYNNEIILQEVKDQEDWGEVFNQQMQFKPDYLSKEHYEDFCQKLMKAYLKVRNLGTCLWFGAYLKNKCVANLGIMWNDEIVGFQRIIVDSQYRGMGIGPSMVYLATQWILENLPNREVIVWSEKESKASLMYRSLGYQFKEDLLAFLKYNEF